MTQPPAHLDDLHRELDRVRIARRVRRLRSLAAACLLLMSSGAWLILHRPLESATQSLPAMADASSPIHTPPPDAAIVDALQADSIEPSVAPSRLERIAGSHHSVVFVQSSRIKAQMVSASAPTRVVRISDAELMATFRAMGDPVGIIRMAGVTTLARLNPSGHEPNRTP